MSKLKVGDVVKITRKAEDGENGWDNTWVEEMDIFVGKNGVVVDIPSDEGVKVYCLEAGDYYLFPKFVLKKIDGGSMSEFKVGDKVRAKHDIENLLGTVKKGSVGVTVLGDPKHKEWSKIFFGKEHYTFDFDGTIVLTDSEDVEKLDPENTETPKNEKKLEKITITLKNRQSAIVIIGNYVSADAEFVYYESRDGKTYEIREDEIIMIVSEDFQND